MRISYLLLSHISAANTDRTAVRSPADESLPFMGKIVLFLAQCLASTIRCSVAYSLWHEHDHLRMDFNIRSGICDDDAEGRTDALFELNFHTLD